MSRGRLSRRDWLRAAGGAALLFPFLRARPGRAATTTPRLVLLMQSNGTGQSNFWPRAPAGLSSPILDPLVGDPVLAAKTTVIRGLRNDVGGAGNGHDFGFAGLYSGYASVGTFHDPWGSGISLDQILRKRLTIAEPYPTLNCGVLASDTPPFKAHRRSFSYIGPRQQVSTEMDPYKLYANLFSVGPPTGSDLDAVAAAKRRLLRKQSVLDYVTGDLKALRGRLGPIERAKLEVHEVALRQIERRFELSLTPAAGPVPPQCGRVRQPPSGLDVTREDNVPDLTKLMLDLVALAIGCRLARIVTFQFGHGGEKWYFRWLGINQNSHDAIAHADDGKNPDVTAKLLTINRWYAQQVADLAHALDAIPEEDGTALDNTLVVWGNEIATGPHGMENLPVVLLGKAAGRLRQTGRLVDQGPQDYRRLGTSLLNIMGVPAQGFGEAPDSGPIRGLI